MMTLMVKDPFVQLISSLKFGSRGRFTQCPYIQHTEMAFSAFRCVFFSFMLDHGKTKRFLMLQVLERVLVVLKWI